jgi:hypothetical protein
MDVDLADKHEADSAPVSCRQTDAIKTYEGRRGAGEES